MLQASLGIIAKYAIRVSSKAIARSSNALYFFMNESNQHISWNTSCCWFFKQQARQCWKKVQIDETMLNYKCKSHRGRLPTNRTDCICLVEVRVKIERAYAVCIPNKKRKQFFRLSVNKLFQAQLYKQMKQPVIKI